MFSTFTATDCLPNVKDVDLHLVWLVRNPVCAFIHAPVGRSVSVRSLGDWACETLCLCVRALEAVSVPPGAPLYDM